MTEAIGPRDFVYARSAFLNQERHVFAIREQVRSARSWIDEHQAELMCVFVERAPLSSLKSRPVLTSMLDLIRSTNAPANTVVVDLPQRIGRFSEYTGIKADLSALGIRLIAIDDLETDLLAGASDAPAR